MRETGKRCKERPAATLSLKEKEGRSVADRGVGKEALRRRGAVEVRCKRPKAREKASAMIDAFQKRGNLRDEEPFSCRQNS